MSTTVKMICDELGISKENSLFIFPQRKMLLPSGAETGLTSSLPGRKFLLRTLTMLDGTNVIQCEGLPCDSEKHG